MTATKRIAYIFQDVGGWYVCDDAGPLDTRGKAHSTKTAAIAAARFAAEQGKRYGMDDQWTHYRTGKTSPRKLV